MAMVQGGCGCESVQHEQRWVVGVVAFVDGGSVYQYARAALLWWSLVRT